jgi:hypothetical protein
MTQGRDDASGDAAFGAPDVTARVMQRLGYVQADGRAARALRRRRAWTRFVQGAIVLSAVALGAIWWFGGTAPARSRTPVVETLRSTVTRGARGLDGFFAGLPRMPQTSVADSPDEADATDATLEHIPQLRSY